MFEKFTSEAIKAVMLAQEEARRLGHNFVGTEQILLGLIGEKTGIANEVLTGLGVTHQEARQEVERIIGRGSGYLRPEIPFTPKVKRLFEQALKESRRLENNLIGTEHLLLGLTGAGEGVATKVLQNLGIDVSHIRNLVIRRLGENVPVVTNDLGGNIRHSNNSTLEEFGRSLTREAELGKLDPVVGREKEIERVIQILGRRRKNNPVLIGEPGVGKTAIAEGLAERIYNQDVPEILLKKQVFSLDMGLLIAGTRFRGNFEERLKNIISEICTGGNIIIFIDEIHTLIGAGSIEGGIDASNILKPALARGDIQCLGATTLDEYRRNIEPDAALERRLQAVLVGEPSVEETIEILHGLRGVYEQHHRLKIADRALVTAAKLSNRYINNRFLPDKAIDLIDEASSRVHLRNSLKTKNKGLDEEFNSVIKQKNEAVKTQNFARASELRDRELELIANLQDSQIGKNFQSVTVEEEDIAQIVTAWTGLPVNKLTESESEFLLHLEEILHRRLIGQEQAVNAVSRAVRRAHLGLRNTNRPITSFLFSGPTGVGKTHLAKALAACLFGSENAMIRLDMSEYMEHQNISQLIGSPPGYAGYDEGGLLTEAVRRKPYTVVLFDEIEKAHPDVLNILLQILEDGYIEDRRGKKVNFNNTLIILTSNLGSKVIEKGGGVMGFELKNNGAEAAYNYIKNLVYEDIRAYFRPELFNRLDEIIIFTQLKQEEIKQIAEILLKEVADRLIGKNIKLKIGDQFKELLVRQSYSSSNGARPLRRVIMNYLEDPLVEAILHGEINTGDTAYIDLDETDKVIVSKSITKDLLVVS